MFPVPVTVGIVLVVDNHKKYGGNVTYIKLFNTLFFEKWDLDVVSGHLRETVKLQAFVPGVNSGVYIKELVIQAQCVKPFKFHRWLKWKFGRKEVSNFQVNLNEKEMIQLRDEINQILRLPFDEE